MVQPAVLPCQAPQSLVDLACNNIWCLSCDTVSVSSTCNMPERFQDHLCMFCKPAVLPCQGLLQASLGLTCKDSWYLSRSIDLLYSKRSMPEQA